MTTDLLVPAPVARRSPLVSGPCVASCALVSVLALRTLAWHDALVIVVWSVPVGAAAVCDLHTARLPDRIVLPGAAATLLASVAAGVGLSAVLGALVLVFPMLLVHLARPDGLGFGDVKYAGLLGAGLGSLSVALVLPAYLLAALVHTLVCLAIRAHHRLFPFGPALAGAAITMAAATLIGRY